MLLIEVDESKIKMPVQPNQAQSWIWQLVIDLSNSNIMTTSYSEKAGFASKKSIPKQETNNTKTKHTKPKKLSHFYYSKNHGGKQQYILFSKIKHFWL